ARLATPPQAFFHAGKFRAGKLLLKKCRLADVSGLRVTGSPLERVAGKAQGKGPYTNSCPQKDASRNLSSASRWTQNRVLRNKDVLKPHSRGVAVPHSHFAVQRRGDDSVLITLPFHEAASYPYILPVLADGSRQDDIEIGVTSVGDEGLLSAQYPTLRSS